MLEKLFRPKSGMRQIHFFFGEPRASYNLKRIESVHQRIDFMRKNIIFSRCADVLAAAREHAERVRFISSALDSACFFLADTAGCV
jgi:hypothetical protein